MRKVIYGHFWTENYFQVAIVISRIRQEPENKNKIELIYFIQDGKNRFNLKENYF